MKTAEIRHNLYCPRKPLKEDLDHLVKKYGYMSKNPWRDISK